MQRYITVSLSRYPKGEEYRKSQRKRTLQISIMVKEVMGGE